MRNLIRDLGDWGCDISGAMERMAGDEAFYAELLNTLSEEPLFPELLEAVRERDGKAAFEKAHALKGIVGNLGLTPLYAIVCKMVELLRPGQPDDRTWELLRRDAAAFETQYEHLAVILHGEDDS